jgi:hypothetical protein
MRTWTLEMAITAVSRFCSRITQLWFVQGLHNFDFVVFLHTNFDWLGPMCKLAMAIHLWVPVCLKALELWDGLVLLLCIHSPMWHRIMGKTAVTDESLHFQFSFLIISRHSWKEMCCALQSKCWVASDSVIGMTEPLDCERSLLLIVKSNWSRTCFIYFLKLIQSDLCYGLKIISLHIPLTVDTHFVLKSYIKTNCAPHRLLRHFLCQCVIPCLVSTICD